MKSPKPITDEELFALQAQTLAPPTGAPKPQASWMPSLLPTQMEVFNDTSDNLLVCGPRYSGKGWACGYHVVRHCWDYYNAMFLIVVKTKRQALGGGFLYKIGNEILPDFKANLEGFDYLGPVVTQEKDIIYKVKNRFGGWSIIQMMSIIHDVDCDRRVRGLEVSGIYCDELTLFENERVFTSLRGALKRRRHIPPEAQRFVATCNPAGPSHWVYKKWMDTSPANRPFFRYIFLPISENPDPNAIAYVESLKRDNESDPIAYQRDIEGKWVERPSGDALFASEFNFTLHVRGDLKTKQFLQPRPGLPISVGWDLGDGANHAIVFTQERLTKEKTLQVVFDEVVYTDSKITYDMLVPEIMDRMNYWCEAMDSSFHFMHISDRSAFDRFRAATGSYDHRQVQQISKLMIEKHPSRYPRLKPIRLTECPKPPGSVAARVKLMIGMLARGEIFFSANCLRVIETMQKLESVKGEPYEPRRSEHLHAFDALTYILYYGALGGSIVARPEPVNTPEFMQVGA